MNRKPIKLPGYFNSSSHKFDLEKFIQNALNEDVGDGDYTSLSCIPATAKGKAKLLIKENGILAGVELAQHIFKKIDKNLRIKILLRDGKKVQKGDTAFFIEGKTHSILKAERLVLNCMQRMSGIATATNIFIKLCQGTKAKILDTRKTTPGIRALEKWAVKIGGGENHRFGLYDLILIKDNHVDYAGGILQAINAANNYLKRKNKRLKIEIEARNMKEVREILSVGKINRILLDNFSPSKMKKAVELVNGRFETEASGGINESNIRSYAKTGVDFISIGALTHSIKSLNMSLKAVK